MRLARAFALFALLLLILTAPWPGVPRLAGEGLAALGRMVWVVPWGGLEVEFQAKPAEEGRAGPLHLEIFSRRLAAPDGSGPVRNVDFDAAGFWWLPTAFLFALIFASPVPWRDKLRVFPAAMLCLQGALLFLLAFVIWREAGHLVHPNDAPPVPGRLLSLFTLAAPVVVWALWMGPSLQRARLAGSRA